MSSTSICAEPYPPPASWADRAGLSVDHGTCSHLLMTYDPGVPHHEVGHAVASVDDIDVVLRWPIGAATAPVVICCHGFTGDANNLSELSTAWASQGYAVIHPTFGDSLRVMARRRPDLNVDPDQGLAWASDPVTLERVVAVTFDPQTWLDRVSVATTVLDALVALGQSMEGLAAGLDLGRIAVAGHSMGAFTAQLLAGVKIEVPGSGPSTFRDQRIQAAVLLAGQGRDQWGLADGSWDSLATPLLNIAGTADDTSASGQGAAWRRQPFELAPPGNRYQAIVADMDHGLGRLATAENPLWADDPTARSIIIATTSAFLDHTLAANADAAGWLNDGPGGSDAERVEWSRK